MSINTVAILSPGDMGHAVGRRLREHELRVVTCLAGRSQRTRALSEEAGIEDMASMEEVVVRIRRCSLHHHLRGRASPLPRGCRRH